MESWHTGFNSQNDKEKGLNIIFVNVFVNGVNAKYLK